MTTYLSVFAGVGGFDLGADATGWECVGQIEWDPHCRQVLARHWPDVPRWGDVCDVDGTTIAADVVIGGFPCQDVSVAGQRAGMATGTRSGLYAELIRIVKEMRDATTGVAPRWVILENVVGLLSVDHGAGFRAVVGDLADLGAHLIEWVTVDSRRFGVPQRRRRVFVAACFDPATADRCPDPLFPVAAGSRGDTRTSAPAGQDVAGTLGGGSGGRGWAADTDRMTFIAFHTTQTPISSTVHTPALSQHDRGVVGVAYAVAENQRGELRLSEQSMALTGGGGKPGQGYPATLTPELAVRRLTPLECERLQGWPDHHTAHTANGTLIADSHRYRMCGNGITAPVAAWITQCVDNANQEQPHE